MKVKLMNTIMRGLQDTNESTPTGSQKSGILVKNPRKPKNIHSENLKTRKRLRFTNQSVLKTLKKKKIHIHNI